MNRRGLGRGLDALLGSAPTVRSLKKPRPRSPWIRSGSIAPAAQGFRSGRARRAGALAAHVGHARSVVVRRTVDGRWQLIAGERRWRAARQAGSSGSPPSSVKRPTPRAWSWRSSRIFCARPRTAGRGRGLSADPHGVQVDAGAAGPASRQGSEHDRQQSSAAPPAAPHPGRSSGRPSDHGPCAERFSSPDPAEQLKLRDEILSTSGRCEKPRRRGAPTPGAAGLADVPRLVALEQAIQRALLTRVTAWRRAERTDRSHLCIHRRAESAGGRDSWGTSLSLRERIVVAMSEWIPRRRRLAVEQGHDVVGVTLRVWPWSDAAEPARRFQTCCGTEATDDARRVARTLGIRTTCSTPSGVRSHRGRPVRRRVPSRAHPGPVLGLQHRAEVRLAAPARAQWDAAAVATGHYARVTRDAASGRYLLWKGGMSARTSRISSGRSARLGAWRRQFPVGELTKDEVRAQARRLGLATADKPESQEITSSPMTTIALPARS